MATVASWHGHEFGIQPGKITGFRDLRVVSEAETETQEQGDDTWLKWKKYKPKKISITCEYVAALGADPWTEAENMIRDLGYTDYFYLGGYKLLPEKVMLTKAEMYDAVIGANTRYWEKVLVDCVFEVAEAGALAWGTRAAQSSSASASTSSSSGGSSGGGGATYKNYKVQIPGMSAVTVKAKSVQDAILKSSGKNHTGTIYVDGKTYQVKKGVLVRTADKNTKKTESKKATQNAISQAVKTVKNALVKFGLVKK